MLGKILTKRMSPRSLSGPIGIAQLSGEAYRTGIPELLLLVSFISLQLGIFNLLPIPVLDGGVILVLLVEFLDAPRFESGSEGTVRASRHCLPPLAHCICDVQ